MKTYSRHILATCIGGAVIFLSGCTGVAPNYTPSISNVEALKNSGAVPTKVGTVTTQPGMPGGEALSMRAASMRSPVGKNFGDYLAAALRSELELANLNDPASPTEVSGSLLRNNVDAGGINTNEAQIEARFVVKRAEQIRFDKVVKTESQWESSFAGAVAIPLAANNYALTVQKLLGQLFADPDFIRAVRR